VNTYYVRKKFLNYYFRVFNIYWFLSVHFSEIILDFLPSLEYFCHSHLYENNVALIKQVNNFISHKKVLLAPLLKLNTGCQLYCGQFDAKHIL